MRKLYRFNDFQVAINNVPSDSKRFAGQGHQRFSSRSQPKRHMSLLTPFSTEWVLFSLRKGKWILKTYLWNNENSLEQCLRNYRPCKNNLYGLWFFVSDTTPQQILWFFLNWCFNLSWFLICLFQSSQIVWPTLCSHIQCLEILQSPNDLLRKLQRRKALLTL